VRNFGVGGNWTQGAVTYGSAVSLSDYTAVVRNFGTSVSGLAVPASTASVTPFAVATVQPVAASTAGSSDNFAATVVDPVQVGARGKRRSGVKQIGGNRRRE